MARRSKMKPTRATPVRISALSKWRTRATELMGSNSDMLHANSELQDTLLKQDGEIVALHTRLSKYDQLLNEKQTIIERQSDMIRGLRERGARTDKALHSLITYTAGRMANGDSWVYDAAQRDTLRALTERDVRHIERQVQPVTLAATGTPAGHNGLLDLRADGPLRRAWGERGNEIHDAERPE